MSVQAQIPPGLAAIHNFIMDHDDSDIHHYLDILKDLNILSDIVEPALFGELGQGAIGREEREHSSTLWDEIAGQMWNSYQEFLCTHPEVLEEEFVAENH